MDKPRGASPLRQFLLFWDEKLRRVALGFDDEDAAEMTKRITLPK
jgi:hypothetical protein